MGVILFIIYILIIFESKILRRVLASNERQVKGFLRDMIHCVNVVRKTRLGRLPVVGRIILNSRVDN